MTLTTLEQPRRGVPDDRQDPRGDRPDEARPRRPDRQARPRPPRHPDHALTTSPWRTGRRSNSTNPCLCSRTCSSETRPGSAASTPETQMTVANLGVNYKDSGRLERGDPAPRRGLPRARASSRTSAGFGAPLLDAYAKAGRSAEVAKLVPEQLAEARKALPKDSPQLAGASAQSSRVAASSSRLMPMPSHSSANAWRSARRPSRISGARSTRSRCSAGHCSARRNTPKPSRC